MSGSDSRSRSRERRAETYRVLALVLLCGFLSFAFLDSRPLWDNDEGMHSATSKDMVETGDWVTPTHNGKPFYDKTALHNWFVAVSFVVFGFTEAAARLPAAILGLLTVLLTYWIGRRMYGPWTGFFGAVILASSVQVIVLTQTIVHDTSLYFFVTAALACFYRGYSASEGSGKWFLLSCASLGMAILAKGPVGLLLPAGVIFFFLAFRRDLKFIGKMQLHWGVPLGLLIAVPWFTAMTTLHADYVEEFFVRLHFGNFSAFADRKATHSQPWFYYVGALFGGFAPWSVWLPGAVWRAWQRRSEDERGATIFLFVWAGLYMVFFSSCESKLSTYILPMFPAAALLTGRLWEEVARWEVPSAAARRWTLWPFAAFLAIPIVAIVLFGRPETSPENLDYTYGVTVLGALMPLVGLFGFNVLGAIFLWRGRGRAAFACVTASIASAILLFVLCVVPGLNRVQSSRDLALEMDRRMPAGEKLLHYHRMRDAGLFYTHRTAKVIRREKALKKRLDGDRRIYVIIAESRYLELELDHFVLMREGENLLISNRRDP